MRPEPRPPRPSRARPRRWPYLLLLGGALSGVVAPTPPAALPALSAAAPQVVRSWQVTHPLGSGVLSGLTWGRWPGQYGADARVEAVQFVQRQGLGVQAFASVQRLNAPLFHAGQVVGSLLLAGVLAGLLGGAAGGGGSRGARTRSPVSRYPL